MLHSGSIVQNSSSSSTIMQRGSNETRRSLGGAGGAQVKDQSPSLTHRAMSGMIWVAWGSGAMAVLKIAVLVVLTRLLSPADFGVVAAALVVIDFSFNFSQLGLGPALVQRSTLEPRHLSTAFFAS